MKLKEPKTPAGTALPLGKFETWPTPSGFKVKVEGRLYFVSDEKIFKGGGFGRIGRTGYKISDGGRVSWTRR